jgi:hypothetical protein
LATISICVEDRKTEKIICSHNIINNVSNDPLKIIYIGVSMISNIAFVSNMSHIVLLVLVYLPQKNKPYIHAMAILPINELKNHISSNINGNTGFDLVNSDVCHIHPVNIFQTKDNIINNNTDISHHINIHIIIFHISHPQDV